MTDIRLLKAREAAVLLGISQSQVYRLINDGTIPSVLIGKHDRRIPRVALEAWVARYSQLPDDLR